MMDTQHEQPGRAKYTKESRGTLSEAILREYAAYTDTDLRNANFRLYDLIDPTSLDTLFRFNQESYAMVAFDLEGTKVMLKDEGEYVDIRIGDAVV